MSTQQSDNDKKSVDSTQNQGASPNVGTGPAKSIPDGGVEGEEKQPKESTGNQTGMGGADGGTSRTITEKKE